MGKLSLTVPAKPIVAVSPPDQDRATQYPHSRVDSDTLLHNPLDVEPKKADVPNAGVTATKPVAKKSKGK